MRSRIRIARWSAGAAFLGLMGMPLSWSSVSDVTSECQPDGAEAASRPGGARDTTEDLRLVLNVPAYRLDVVTGGAVSRSIPVAVGEPKYRTPLGRFRMAYVVWNPWWRPPPSEWARNEKPRPPGWQNPVGRVKLHVTELVFMHGTPHDSSLGSAASHACIRMTNADAIALARLVHQHAGPVLPATLLDSLVADTSRTRTIALTRTVPVEIRYDLAEVRAGELHVHPDVYRLGGRSRPTAEASAMAALLSAGRDTTGVRRDRVRQLVRVARRAAARIAVDSLYDAGGTRDSLQPWPLRR